MIALVIFILPIIYIAVFADNKTLVWEQFEIDLGTEVSSDEGIRIVHLSDLHFPKENVNTDELVKGIKEQSPDIIAITGDLVDSRNPAIDSALGFLKKIHDICEVYYIYGNHETRILDADGRLLSQIKSQNINVKLLKNEYDTLYIRGIKVIVAGIIDDEPYRTTTFSDIAQPTGEKPVKILLAHRPERFSEYTNSANIFLPDLILSGHTHGGQIRLPLLGGLFAPNNGFLPKYDGGIFYAQNGSAMINSRGIGNSIFPFRVGNKPHVPVIKLC